MVALDALRLYGILDLGYVRPDDAQAMARQMVEGGVDILQLRAKSQSLETIREAAAAIAPICRMSGVPFLLNDHPGLVAETGADGVHVGQDDMTVTEARRIVGPGAIVGLSTHSLDQALAAGHSAPDYIGFGPLFSTPTKPDYPPVGLGGLREVHLRIPIPIFCIGGIKLENLGEVLAAGAVRAAVVSGILQAEDPAAYCRKCAAMLRCA
ncbi:MAG: thiamine phosphate synthase [Verrucomicrobiae bacterium]